MWLADRLETHRTLSTDRQTRTLLTKERNIAMSQPSPASQSALIVVGLGPGRWEDVTVAALDVLDTATSITFRTLRHPTVVALRERRPDLTMTSFDELYEQNDDWETLYTTMALQLLDATAEGTVIYAVPGHPLVGESSVRTLRLLAAERGVPLRIVAGLSFLEPICATLALDPIGQGLQIIDATELAALQPQEVAGAVVTNRPAMVTQVYNRRMASAAKLALLEVFPPEWSVTLVRAAGLPEERLRTVALSAIDHDEFADHLTTLYVPALPPESLQSRRSPESLRYIIARLRAPDGCPWDRKQTHASLTRYVLEEAAEVADAIDEVADDPMHLAEELGDLLLQVYLHTEIAQEEELFSIGDVYEAITSKMIRRHPHVFGTTNVADAEQVVQNWEKIKQTERESTGEVPTIVSKMQGITRHAAALTNAHEIQKRAVKTGFDWPTLDDWVVKLNEEVAELLATETFDAREDELGDLIFTLVALARKLDIDAEVALRRANTKFRDRFMRMETLAHERGDDFATLDRDAHRLLWQAAKDAEHPATDA